MSEPSSTPNDKTTSENGRRVTMKDIAALAKVHKTTVSLALRNHPSIPESTRVRIREIANRLGYLPDPTLEAFNFHRLANHPARSAPAMAFLTDLPSSSAFDSSSIHHQLYRGAKEKAESMGYTLERFFVGPKQLSPSRLNHILESRNISYLILGAFSTNTTELPLDWRKLHGLKIESFHVQPKLDVITANHRDAARIAVHNMKELGYRNIGLVLSRDQDLRLANLHHAGFLVEYQNVIEAPPILFIDDLQKAQVLDAVHKWVFRNHLDGIIAADDSIATMIACHTPLVPTAVGLCSLEVSEPTEHAAGIIAGNRLVGARAVELLAIGMHTNQRGLPEHTSTTYIPVIWHPGQTAPRRSKIVKKLSARRPGLTV